MGIDKQTISIRKHVHEICNSVRADEWDNFLARLAYVYDPLDADTDTPPETLAARAIQKHGVPEEALDADFNEKSYRPISILPHVRIIMRHFKRDSDEWTDLFVRMIYYYDEEADLDEATTSELIEDVIAKHHIPPHKLEDYELLDKEEALA